MEHDELIKITVFSARYQDEESAKAGYYAAKKCYEQNHVLEDFNAAVAFHNSSNKIKIIVKNEYTTRQQTWLGMLIGFGIAVFTIIFVAILIPGYFSPTEPYEQHHVPFKVILVTALGALIGGLLGHFQSGIGRSDLKELAKVLHKDEYGLMVVCFGDMSEKIKELIPTDNQVSIYECETTKKKLVGKIKKAFIH